MDVRGDYEKDKAGGLGRLYPFSIFIFFPQWGQVKVLSSFSSSIKSITLTPSALAIEVNFPIVGLPDTAAYNA